MTTCKKYKIRGVAKFTSKEKLITKVVVLVGKGFGFKLLLFCAPNKAASKGTQLSTENPECNDTF